MTRTVTAPVPRHINSLSTNVWKYITLLDLILLMYNLQKISASKWCICACKWIFMCLRPKAYCAAIILYDKVIYLYLIIKKSLSWELCFKYTWEDNFLRLNGINIILIKYCIQYSMPQPTLKIINVYGLYNVRSDSSYHLMLQDTTMLSSIWDSS